MQSRATGTIGVIASDEIGVIASDEPVQPTHVPKSAVSSWTRRHDRDVPSDVVIAVTVRMDGFTPVRRDK
jgi:hypothetical protein